MGEGDLDVRFRDRVQPAEHALVALAVFGQRRHAELEQRLVDEGPVTGRDQLAQVELAALGRDLGRHDDIDPVGMAVGIGVHPVQRGVEVFRVVVADAAENAKAASLG